MENLCPFVFHQTGAERVPGLIRAKFPVLWVRIGFVTHGTHTSLAQICLTNEINPT